MNGKHPTMSPSVNQLSHLDFIPFMRSASLYLRNKHTRAFTLGRKSNYEDVHCNRRPVIRQCSPVSGSLILNDIILIRFGSAAQDNQVRVRELRLPGWHSCLGRITDGVQEILHFRLTTAFTRISENARYVWVNFDWLTGNDLVFCDVM